MGGKRHGRLSWVSFSVAAGLVIAAAVLGPNLMSLGDRDEPVTPVQSPRETVAPTPTSTAPIPVFENLSPGWTELEAPPEPRAEAVSVWSGRSSSGRDLILWGGYSEMGATMHEDGFSWDPDTNAWTPLAKSPLAPRAGAGAAFTGSEIVIWGGYGGGGMFSDGAAYDPETDRWRMLPEAPIEPARPVATVWTGKEVLVWGSTERSAGSNEGAAYNPSTDEWRPLPEAPAVINAGTAVWTDQSPAKPQEMVVFGAELDDNNVSKLAHAVGIAYNPESDTWRELPDVNLSPQASAIAWTKEGIIAWDYELAAANYTPGTNVWYALPDVPLDDLECYPATETIGAYIFAWYCGRAALWDFLEQEWKRIETPRQIVPGEPIVAGEILLFAGAMHASRHNALWAYVPPPGS